MSSEAFVSHMSFSPMQNGKRVDVQKWNIYLISNHNIIACFISSFDWQKIGTQHLGRNLNCCDCCLIWWCASLFPCQRAPRNASRERFDFLFRQIISLNGSRKCVLSNGGCRKSITASLLETVLDFDATMQWRLFAFAADRPILTFF